MQAHILEGARTAFGSFGGTLKNTGPVELGRVVAAGAIERSEVPREDIQEVFFGNVLPANSQSIYLARHIALHAGLRADTAALTLNRLCGSGMEAAAQAMQGILTGRFQVALAGGVENMSQTPYISSGFRWGQRMGDAQLEDMLLQGLTDRYVDMAMGRTAENLAREYSISREEQDAWAERSQKRAAAARENGRLRKEIVPVQIKSKKQVTEFDADEFIRTEGLEKLPALPPVFLEGGSVTAGNASGINDGASAMLIASEEYAQSKGLKSLAILRGFGVSGCAPEKMGIGPALAIPKALAQAGLELKDMDLIEVNEAFAAQYLAVQKELGLDPERTNVNGGAIALGHPLGASGNRVLLTLAYELRERGAKYGVASLCIGGGQGIAMVIENPNAG